MLRNLFPLLFEILKCFSRKKLKNGKRNAMLPPKNLRSISNRLEQNEIQNIKNIVYQKYFLALLVSQSYTAVSARPCFACSTKIFLQSQYLEQT